MSAIDWVVLAFAALVAYPCACRVKVLRLGEHRTEVVALHQILGAGVMWSAYHALSGVAGIVELCLVLVAALWIAISYWSWSAGVPSWVIRPQPVPAGVLQRVVGGNRKGAP